MSVYTFAWIASITYGLEAVMAKLMNRHAIANPWLLTFLWNLFILAMIVPIALWNGVGVPFHWGYIVAGSLLYAAGSVLFILALSQLDVSVLTPLFSFRTAMALLLGAMFLNEVLTAHQYLLVAIIFAFGFLVSVDEKFSPRSFFHWGTAVALADMVVLALLAMCIKKSVAVSGYWDTTLWMALIGQVWLLLAVPLWKADILKMTSYQYGAVVIVAIAGVVADLAANAAYARNVSLSAAIISLPVSMFIAFLFSVFAPELLEKHSLKVYTVRFASAAIMVAAALNL